MTSALDNFFHWLLGVTDMQKEATIVRRRDLTAEEAGWKRRDDLDPKGQVWERPDGKLYVHFNTGMPLISELCATYPWDA